MNEGENNPDLQTWIDPELEARIVASVLGEASAFEVAEMERIAGEKPELAIFKRRIEAIHGIIGGSMAAEKEPMRLSAERRNKLLEVFASHESREPASSGSVRSSHRNDSGEVRIHSLDWWRVIQARWGLVFATCLLFVVVAGVTTLFFPRTYYSKVTMEVKPDDYGVKAFGGSEVRGPSSSTRPFSARPLTEMLSRLGGNNDTNQSDDPLAGAPPAAAAAVPETAATPQSLFDGVEPQLAEVAGNKTADNFAYNADLLAALPADRRAFAEREGTDAKASDARVKGEATAHRTPASTMWAMNGAEQSGRERRGGAPARTPQPSSGSAPKEQMRGETAGEEAKSLGAVASTDNTSSLGSDSRRALEKSDTASLRGSNSYLGETAAEGPLPGSKPSDEKPALDTVSKSKGIADNSRFSESIGGFAGGGGGGAGGRGKAVTSGERVVDENGVFQGRIDYGSPIRPEIAADGAGASRQIVPMFGDIPVQDRLDKDRSSAMDTSSVTGGVRSGNVAIAGNGIDALPFPAQAAPERPAVPALAATGRAEVELTPQIPQAFGSLGAGQQAEATPASRQAMPVPGKPGFVTSPYAPYSGYVDARGFAAGTEIKDPYTGKAFVVPSSAQADSPESAGMSEVKKEKVFLSPVGNGDRQKKIEAVLRQMSDNQEIGKTLTKKLDDIIIPKIEFRDATVSEALEFLKQKSRELDTSEADPTKRGVNIVSEFETLPRFAPEPSAAAASVPHLETMTASPAAPASAPAQSGAEPRLTLSLSNIPLKEALQYVTATAGLKTTVDAGSLKVVPVTTTTETLITKEFPLPPNFIENGSAREFLEANGITFPAGASANYLRESGMLVVRNTPANLDLIDPLAEIATTTKQQALDEITQSETLATQQPFSTFSLHVSDVSFRLAQAALAKGEKPDAESIRPEEFYNAFDYADPAPGTGEKVACRIEQSAHPFLQQRNLVRVAMKVGATGRGQGQPLRLTVLLDTSGSMEREDRAASVRAAMQTLASLLGPDDLVTLIGFARQPRLLADQLSGKDAAKLVDMVASTPSEGGTNLEEALRLAGQKALKQRSAVAQNRIVLLTDGAANLGNARPAQLARMIEELRQRGIAFDACGVGADGLNDEVLEALTRKGDGRYYLLNGPEDADAGFARQLAGAFRPAAQNVKVQVHFNPARVARYRLIGFEQHRLKKEDFRNDKVDAAELAAEEAAVAIYQVEALPQGEGEMGEVSVRFRDSSNGGMVERSWTMNYDAQARAFDQAAPSMQLAGTAAMLAEKLRGGAIANFVELDALAPVVNGLRGSFSQQARVQELVTMFEQMRRMK